MQYDYRKAIEEDLKWALENDYDLNEYIDVDADDDFTDDDIIAEARENLYEDLWVDDSVTGNGSGSYTSNEAEAKEYVLNATDGVVYEAFYEYCDFERLGKLFANGDFIVIDVIVRTYLLGEALDNWIEDNREYLVELIKQKRENLKKDT